MIPGNALGNSSPGDSSTNAAHIYTLRRIVGDGPGITGHHGWAGSREERMDGARLANMQVAAFINRHRTNGQAYVRTCERTYERTRPTDRYRPPPGFEKCYAVIETGAITLSAGLWFAV